MEFDIDRQTRKYTKNKTNTCEYIVLHHTAGTTNFNSQVNYLCNNQKQVSCHYIVGLGGEIAKISSEDKVTWHAGKSNWEGKTSLNYYSIGIEVINDGHKFSDVQRGAVKNLINDIRKRRNLSAESIIRHKDIAPGRKTDIYDEFWNGNYKDWKSYQQSYLNQPKLILNPLIKTLVRYLIKHNGTNWNKSINSIEKDLLHRTNDQLRNYLEFYK